MCYHSKSHYIHTMKKVLEICQIADKTIYYSMKRSLRHSILNLLIAVGKV